MSKTDCYCCFTRYWFCIINSENKSWPSIIHFGGLLSVWGFMFEEGLHFKFSQV